MSGIFGLWGHRAGPTLCFCRDHLRSGPHSTGGFALLLDVVSLGARREDFTYSNLDCSPSSANIIICSIIRIFSPSFRDPLVPVLRVIAVYFYLFHSFPSSLVSVFLAIIDKLLPESLPISFFGGLAGFPVSLARTIHTMSKQKRS